MLRDAWRRLAAGWLHSKRPARKSVWERLPGRKVNSIQAAHTTGFPAPAEEGALGSYDSSNMRCSVITGSSGSAAVSAANANEGEQ